jgi:hypothetical protein
MNLKQGKEFITQVHRDTVGRPQKSRKDNNYAKNR